MKKSLLLTALLGASFAHSQMTSSNEPAIGESVNMYLCDENTPDLEASTGATASWDYSTLAGDPSETRLMSIVAPASTPFASDFPTSTKCYEVENTIRTYFTTSASDKISQGFQFNETTAGDVIAKYGGDEQLWATYPFDFGSSTGDLYNGDLSFDLLGTPVNEALGGISYSFIDGTGTLTFPNNVSLSNVMRFKIVDTALTTLPFIGVSELIRVQYEYYDYADQNLPVFIHTKITLGPAGGTPVTSFAMVLSKYEPMTVGLNEAEVIDFNVHPNPTSDVITINGAFTTNAEAGIYDQSGRLLETLNVENGTTINVVDYAPGLYFVTVSDNGIRTTKKVFKK